MENEFLTRATELLEAKWTQLQAFPIAEATVPPNIVNAIDAVVNSTTKTYRYAILTQVLAKAVDPSLDAHAIQKGSVESAFDARSLCHKVVVPFDQSNEKVLGGSAEPYVNKPVRFPRLDDSVMPHQKNKSDFASLLEVLDYVNGEDADPSEVLDSVLIHVLGRLESVKVEYPAPVRVSLPDTMGLFSRFLGVGSGGDRLETVVTAMFQVIGERFGMFDEVRRQHVNASDASTGNVLDSDCVKDGEIVCSIETKDRPLTLLDVEALILPDLKLKKVTEAFAFSRGKAPQDADEIENQLDKSFAGGHNLYSLEFEQFAEVVCALLGEQGRAALLEAIGKELDLYSTVEHRRAWAVELQKL